MTNQSYPPNAFLSDAQLPWEQTTSSSLNQESPHPSPTQTEHKVSIYDVMMNTPLPKYCSWYPYQNIPVLRIQNTDPVATYIAILVISIFCIFAICLAIIMVDKPSWFFISLGFLLFLSFICVTLYYLLSATVSTWILFDGSTIKTGRGYMPPQYWNTFNPCRTTISSLLLQMNQTNHAMKQSEPNNLSLKTLSLIELPMPYATLRENMIQSYNTSSEHNEPYFPYASENLNYQNMHPAKRMMLENKELQIAQNIENMKTQSQLVVMVKTPQDYESIANLLKYFIELNLSANLSQQ